MEAAVAGGTITIRTDPEIEERLNELARATERSRNWLVADALRQYLDTQAWQVEGIMEAQRSLAEGDSVPFEDVMSDLEAKVDRAMKARGAGGRPSSERPR